MKKFNYFFFSEFVDQFLDQYDIDKDGYLSYGEFMTARNEDEH